MTPYPTNARPLAQHRLGAVLRPAPAPQGRAALMGSTGKVAMLVSDPALWGGAKTTMKARLRATTDSMQQNPGALRPLVLTPRQAELARADGWPDHTYEVVDMREIVVQHDPNYIARNVLPD